jgi:hypothetical protein
LLSLFAKEKLTKVKKAHKDNFYMRLKRIFDEKRNKQDGGADEN